MTETPEVTPRPSSTAPVETPVAPSESADPAAISAAEELRKVFEAAGAIAASPEGAAETQVQASSPATPGFRS